MSRTKPPGAYTQHVAAAITWSRMVRNLNQQQMADKLHMSQANYSRLESGRQHINADQLAAIAKALHMRASTIAADADAISKGLPPRLREDDGTSWSEFHSKPITDEPSC